MIRVLVVDDAPLTLGNIERVLASEADLESCGTAQDGETALTMVRATQPGIVLLDMDIQHGEGLRVAHAIATEFPAVAVVVMGLDDDEETDAAVRAAGARDYLVKPFGADELLAALRRVASEAPAPAPAAQQPAEATPGHGATLAERARNANQPVTLPSLLDSVPAQVVTPAAPVTVAIPPPNPERQVIVVASGKGGAGTTVLATSLALIAANEARRRAAIVDMDIQHGDVRRLLRVDNPEGIVDVARASASADRQALIPRLVDGPAKVMALLAPPLPNVESALSADFVAALLLQLRAIADIIIIDLPVHIGAAEIAAMRAADRVVLVSSMNDPGVRATQGMLRLLQAIDVPEEKIVVALNRNEGNSDIHKPEVEEALGRTAAVQFPYDPMLVSTSINRGAPFVLQKPNAQVSRKVRELAGLLFPMPEYIEDAPPERAKRTPAAPRDDDEGRRRPKKKGLFSLISKD